MERETYTRLVESISLSETMEEIVDSLSRDLSKIVHFEIGALSLKTSEYTDERDCLMSDDMPHETFEFTPMSNLILNGDEVGDILCDLPERDEEWKGACSNLYRAKTLEGDTVLVNLNSLFLAPLHSAGERIGTLALFSSKVEQYKDMEEGILNRFWEILGSAIGKIYRNKIKSDEIGRVRKLVDESEAVLVTWMMNGSVWEVDFNLRAEDFIDPLSGFPDSLDGIFFVPPGDDRARADALWRQAYSSGETHSIGLGLTDHEGLEKQFLCSFSPIKEDGRIVGVSMTGIEMGSIDLSMSELSDLNRSYRSLVARLSHHIINPLSAISGYTELMAVSASDDQRFYMHKILGISMRMSDIIHQAKMVADLKEGRIKKEFRGIDLSRSLIRATERIRCRGIGDGIRYLGAEGALQITAHPHVEEVFYNILDYCFEGRSNEPVISISTYTSVEGAIISFRIRGMNIPELAGEGIFMELWGGRPGPDIRGSGLGLAAAAGMVYLHGGRIRGEDEEDGTSIKIFLPWDPK
ncbi:MAG: sensor histidine kinase [Thermoplasmatota archaeon]